MKRKTEPLSTAHPLRAISPQDFRKQIDQINNSRQFSKSHQLQQFLNLLAAQMLSDRAKPLTQEEIARTLGLRQFDSTKPTVRIAAGRLRLFLSEFYRREGKNDPLIIEFPKGAPYRLTVRQRTRRVLPRSDQAFQKYTEGRMLWALRTPETLKKAVSCFEEALQLDPNYAEPHAALAECYLFMAVWGMTPRKVMPLGRRHAQAAVRINPLSAEAHATLGGILSGYDWDWGKAWKAFDRAFELDAHSVTAYCLRAAHLLSVGNPEGAAQDAHLTLRMTSASPSPLVNTHVAKILYAARLYDEAEDLLVRVREMMPDFYLVHWQMGLVLASKGQLACALESLEMAARLSPDGPSVIACLGWAKALSGDIEGAQRIIGHLLQKRKRQYIPASDVAMLYGAVDNMDRAFEWLDRACHERALFLSWLAVWPPFECLYHDPRSKELLARMNLNRSDLRRN